MLISADDLKILREHSAKLLASSDSLEAWLASPYGALLHFVNRDSLKDLRQYWTQYQTFDTSGKAAADLRNGVSQRSKEIGESIMLNGLRSAGPAWPDALEIVGHLYRKYWQTGVAGGSSEDCKKLGKKDKSFANPMFAISSAPSGNFAVHYGTEPLLGFHLAETYRTLGSGQKMTPASQSDKLVQAAKNQFKEWCQAFLDVIKTRRVRIQLFFGEAVTFCHELQLELGLGRRADHARAYTRPWCLQPLRMDGDIGPQDFRWAFFDVVDTSNLGDHIGLINMITATAPLLRPRPTSVLCTESLLAVTNDATTALSAALGSDVATFSLLVGLAPFGIFSGTTFEGVSNEAMLQKVAGDLKADGSQRQYRLRVHWKAHDPSSRVKVDPDELAVWFIAVYKKMFAHEDMSTFLSRMQRMQSTHYSTDMPRYTRAAIVALIRIVKTRTLSDWDRVMDKFLELVETDRSLIVGSNSLQELNVHLALSGVWTLPVLAEGPRQIQDRFHLSLRPKTNESGILGQANPPPIVYVVMSVPRKSLKALTESKVDKMGSPGLHMSIKQQLGMNQYENCFFSFHCYFERFRPNDQADGPSNFEEDDKGWRGSADLFVACAVPTFGLLTGPKNGLRVSLVLNTSPENLMLFKQKLGPLLIVFETPLENEPRVSICRDPLHLNTKSSITDQQEWLQKLSNKHDAEQAVFATFSAHHQVNKLQIRTMFMKESEEGKALAGGASVAVNRVDLFTVQLKIGDTPGRDISFPFPIQSYNSMTRVARKSSWIEVILPIHVAPRKDPFDTWTHVSSLPDQHLALDYIPRVNLDIQPIMKFTTQKDGTWLNILTGIGAMSVAEQQVHHQGNSSSESSKSEFKQSLSVMFSSFMGFHPQVKEPIRIFQLTLRRNQSTHAYIFVRSLRHDLDLGSIALDAYFMPLTKARLQTLSAAVPRLLSVNAKPALGLSLSDDESTLWKRLLPALAERCRTWQHKGTCEYRSNGKIPLSVEPEENPLCTCGEGQTPSDFAEDNEEWAPFAKYVTRIAIAPVFPVPYVEATAAPTDFAQTIPAAQSAGSGPKCDNCNTASTEVKNCAACGKARYCSKECQKTAWKVHKPHCKK